ncbi:MAG: CorA family divalent cation transporter [Sphaerochaetaceae bacterium]
MNEHKHSRKTSKRFSHLSLNSEPGVPVYIGDTIAEQTIITKKVFKNFHWLHVTGLADIEAIKKIGLTYKLSNYTMEDILNTTEPARIDFDNSNYLFITCEFLHEGQTEQLAIVMGKEWILTFHEHKDQFFDSVDKYPPDTPPQLLCAIWETLVNHSLNIADELETNLLELEDRILKAPSSTDGNSIHEKRSMVQNLKHCSLPYRDITLQLSSNANPFVDINLRPRLKNCYELVISLIDNLDDLRESALSLMDLYVAALDNHLNLTMRIMAVISTMFIPITFITGLFGMNFTKPPKITEQGWGFFAITLFCAAIASIMGLLFKRKHWW